MPSITWRWSRSAASAAADNHNSAASRPLTFTMLVFMIPPPCRLTACPLIRSSSVIMSVPIVMVMLRCVSRLVFRGKQPRCLTATIAGAVRGRQRLDAQAIAVYQFPTVPPGQTEKEGRNDQGRRKDDVGFMAGAVAHDAPHHQGEKNGESRQRPVAMHRHGGVGGRVVG